MGLLTSQLAKTSPTCASCFPSSTLSNTTRCEKDAVVTSKTSFLQKRHSSAQPVQEEPAMAVCAAKLSKFVGTNLTPDPSGKNDFKLKELIKADRCYEHAAEMSEEEACDAVPTFTIKDPEYSNLAGQGPDSDGPKGVLYPDAAVIDGKSVDLLVTSKKFKSSDATKNGAAGGLVSLNMKCGKSATVTMTFVGKDKDPVVVPAAAVTVLDIDEGKKGKARTTVSSCGALSATAGSELDVEGEGGCKVYSSTTHGTADNNPQSSDAITDDQKKRAVTFLYGQGSSFEFDVAIGKGSGGRNLLFSLSPVLACQD